MPYPFLETLIHPLNCELCLLHNQTAIVTDCQDLGLLTFLGTLFISVEQVIVLLLLRALVFRHKNELKTKANFNLALNAVCWLAVDR